MEAFAPLPDFGAALVFSGVYSTTIAGIHPGSGRFFARVIFLR